MFRDKTILITGGTGSFGNAVLRRLCDFDCREIRVFSRDELKQELMRNELGDPKVKFYIGDVRNRDSVEAAMKNVDLVFHAAALKQVPSCEFFPMQAVLTNVIGSSNVLEAAIRQRVSKVVCLSTDKAVYPINAMGMTKALMEKVAQAAARSAGPGGTMVCCVRYGNVMYSRGSAIPLFVRQIKEKKPLTVTEPSMTRFMLSLENAIDLVLYAFGRCRQGDIFVRKAPACTVMDLTTALKNLFASDCQARVIGIRHGEKIYETLLTKEELRRADDLGEYYRIQMDNRDLNYSKYFTEGDPGGSHIEDYTSHSTQRLDVGGVEGLLLGLPEIRKEMEEMGRRAAANILHGAKGALKITPLSARPDPYKTDWRQRGI